MAELIPQRQQDLHAIPPMPETATMHASVRHRLAEREAERAGLRPTRPIRPDEWEWVSARPLAPARRLL